MGVRVDGGDVTGRQRGLWVLLICCTPGVGCGSSGEA